MSDKLTVCAVGDVILDRKEPRTAFELVQPILRAADITFGNCESSYSEIGSPNPATRGVVWAGPEQVDGLAWAGFDVMSYANNHHMDAGYDAFRATMRHLHEHGIATCGAGEDLAAARKPAVVERNGTRVAFLGYSSILFPGYEAGPGKPGCVPLRVATHYAMTEGEQPGCAARMNTYVEHSSLEMLREDIARAREQADVVIVTPHWGLHFTPAIVADYESEWGRAAIDAGADLVVGHHQHILKGIEVYRGKTIFHGLGNFVMDVHLPTISTERVKDMKRHNPEYAITYYPDYPTYPYHPAARQTVIAQARIENGQVVATSFVPCLINPSGQPEPLRSGDPRFVEVAGYQQRISAEVGFETKFEAGEDAVYVVG
ncbi:MAG: CapA family protein [Pseudonocardia sp.]|uniref:CapA family protein n=1 Tax=unclassified Pseudonocardia TaxID=2619320 RepID=UPI00086B5FB0|nr:MULTISPECIES: CapA family protein [unclassified Pseudonocardia]MBN9108379.1 CapA family protein [Pseudonocardia sp.]ODU30357.1 MAG: hypothetical protein ABS80_00350 [Pseudonocardia sp. SCN 72-51]ODV08754.1 MAG: hypothetical protein ABT15_02795 [Pseudonocardia sp. SCN 73-27]